MATSYKTPGVFVEEIPKLPPSVAQVETAIPAFIGYTEKAEKNGEALKLKPTRISSLVEFETYFGGPYVFVPGDIRVQLNEGNNFSVTKVEYRTKLFYLYNSMRMFFDNGGGDCYIVSVNSYTAAGFTTGVITSSADLTAGVAALEKYDEPTIIVIPDAVNLSDAEFYPIQQTAIAQCAKLQDRVAVLDVKENKPSTDWATAVTNFRDNIGISNLKYAAAYTPWLLNSYSNTIDFSLLNATGAVVDSTNANLSLANLTTDTALNSMVTTAANAATDLNTIKTDLGILTTASFKTMNDRYLNLRNAMLKATDAATAAAFEAMLVYVRLVVDVFPEWRRVGSSKRFLNSDLEKSLDSMASDSINGLRKFAVDLIAYEKNTAVDALIGTTKDYTTNYQDFPAADAASWIGVNDVGAGIPALGTVFGPTGTDTERRAAVIAAVPSLDAIFKGLDNFFTSVYNAASTYKTITQDALYANHSIVSSVVNAVKKELSKLPPCATIAGIYARVDNARGVWKAPANESLSSVTGPSVQITAEQQSSLNVDTIAGKSINAIRSFTGKGTLVWGARTLAGNDNEWRYISVRRFFNMVEESSKKSTEPFVFEPNDANTWVKVQGMIENFLTTLWRQGALQGAKPEHAFYVAVGLGKTMTALDILEGRMIVEIGMAVVRPAEFIILRFSHKMAES